MSADAVADDITRADVSRRKQARASAWRRVEARGGSWRRVERVINPTETFSDAWGRVRSPMTLNLSQFYRSARDDLCGSFKTTIGAMFVVVM